MYKLIVKADSADAAKRYCEDRNFDVVEAEEAALSVSQYKVTIDYTVNAVTRLNEWYIEDLGTDRPINTPYPMGTLLSWWNASKTELSEEDREAL